MKKLIEIKTDTNAMIRVFGKTLAIRYDHRLIRFPLSRSYETPAGGKAYAVRRIDAQNAELCRINMSAKGISRYLQAEDTICGYLFQDPETGEAVGYYWLFFRGAREAEYTVRGDGSAALISNIYVFEAFRGQRILGQLLLHAFSVCRERGVQELYASVRRNNASAWKGYDRIGYEEAGSRRFFRLLGHNIPTQYIP